MTEIPSQKKKVFVGLSGGVDSSVSAALLKQARPDNFEELFGRRAPEGFKGYDVTGIYIKPWQPDFVPCTWREERHDAMRVAVALDIPFQTLDLSKEYKRDVADYMIAEYSRGRTPNPDIMCNRAIKFGAFWEWAKQEGADAIATGHYARIEESIREIQNSKSPPLRRRFGEASKILNKDKKDKTQTGKNTYNLQPTTYHLVAGVDSGKDQSYFLWTLGQNDLEHVLFPVGGYEKSEVRQLAEKFKLPTAEKKDSQGICFLGEIDMKEFLGHYIHTHEGNVLNTEGEIIGTHSGALLYTLGERRGFTVTQKTPDTPALYVVAKDIKANTITVAPKSAEGTLPEAQKEISLVQVHWIGEVPEEGIEYTARIRYRQTMQEVTIVITGDTSAKLHFKEAQSSVAGGQSVVVYDGERCLGGGIVA